MEILRKRNASDGDSGFDSALSSRSSSISLEESHELLDFKVSKVEESSSPVPLRDHFSHILTQEEDIFQDVCTPYLYIIRDRLSGTEVMYKPPSKLSFNMDPPQIGETYSAEEYNRCNPIPRAHLFNARLQLELEKQVAKMDLLEVDLLMDKNVVPPPSLGIRIIGVNMIHGVPDKLNIYVKRVMEGSVAGRDGRIRVNDHIVEVNGISLVGVSQKLAAEALSSCAVNPETGVVHFVLARMPASEEMTDCPRVDVVDATPKDAAVRVPPPVSVPQPRGGEVVGDAAATVTAIADQTCDLAPPAIASTALYCGQSKVFIPVGSTESTRQPLNLSDMPVPVLRRIYRFLSPEDLLSLRKVNKSFCAALNPAADGHPQPIVRSRKSPTVVVERKPASSTGGLDAKLRMKSRERLLVPCV